jgi:hypothetical protein
LVFNLASVYLAFGVSATAGFASLPLVFSSAFFTTGVVPGLTGDVTGLAGFIGLAGLTGLAGTTGAGVTAGFSGMFVLVSVQAPSMATVAAKTVDSINDLLIVFLHY